MTDELKADGRKTGRTAKEKQAKNVENERRSSLSYHRVEGRCRVSAVSAQRASTGCGEQVKTGRATGMSFQLSC